MQYWENRSTAGPGLVLDPRVSFFSTSTNYDQNSKSNAIPGGVSASQHYFDLNGAYGIGQDWTVFGRFSVLTESIQNSGQINLSNSGLADQLIGTAYKVIQNPSGFGLDLQFDAELPAYSNDSAKENGKAYLGDASNDFTLGAFAHLPLQNEFLSDLSLEFGAGYTYRSNGFSSSIPVNLLLKRNPHENGVMFSAGILGQFSLSTDAANSNASIYAQVINDNKIGAGGSDLVGGIDPAWLSLHASIGYRTSSTQTLYASITAPFQGTSAPSGIALSFGLVFDFTHSLSDSSPKSSSTKEASLVPLDAKIISVNDQLYLVKIDKGSTNQVEVGQLFDIFRENEKVARAQVTHLKDDEAALSVVEYYQDHWIESGFTARRIVK